MSVNDLDSDFLSGDSDHEAESMLPDGGTDEERYLELVHLFNRLMTFEDIYANNTVIDTEYNAEAQLGSRLATGCRGLMQQFIHNVLASSCSSSSSDDESGPDDGSGSDVGPGSDAEGSAPSLSSSPVSDGSNGHIQSDGAVAVTNIQ